MLYYLFEYLDKTFDLPGAGLFRYLSFRAAMAIIVSLFITLFLGKGIIRLLLRKQVGETIRDLGLEGQAKKQGTPTMGGLIILSAILIPVLLFTKLNNIYVIIMIVSTIWLGAIGFLDDYIKVFKKDKKGLAGKFKVIGQIGLGLIVGALLYFHQGVVVRERMPDNPIVMKNNAANLIDEIQASENTLYSSEDVKSTATTIPFMKNNEFDYSKLVAWMGEGSEKYTWIAFILIVILIVTAVSNGANITDGIDGLATGTSAIIGTTLAIFAYVSGNMVFADYLNIMYIPNAGELMVFMSAFVGACVGFLWFNAYPAQVFMGDTGSLALGGIIAVFAIAIRKELLIPIICGIFLVENLSVMIQVSYFKYTKKKYGEGRRIFKMSPLHHHYQKLGYHEAKIVTRFWIIGIMLAVLSVVTLKLR
ncbi:MAG: phospho-N-acetylmuramoyl-pentapeptide-transferase [Bacteroidia bacterium]|nr:phospho-N-acetylmuramoyl-pentapeptide-transferase [Bacteroidota bacterium]MBP9083127.1 phospho-N-acetylmuramoyl-pentapeptide-transferase [Bacteroidia bacterium]MBK7970849.1 phospho-N-acetylmuramoyl-pentapeptide-transferase [Bacteroidota bacterium]MBK8415796.1 phospho-N-acetylmuramoyl-pentapeptide-transferase [Bacteroidota bacterium]MBK8875338.1 phospho-N-acetylmuramoyl-pentapeptide-transferase [Bacteroidota bacterium]